MQITEAMIEAGAKALYEADPEPHDTAAWPRTAEDDGYRGSGAYVRLVFPEVQEDYRRMSRACIEAAIEAGQEEATTAAGLTPRMKECLDFIRTYHQQNGGVSPSFAQIAHGLGLASRGGVSRLVESLEERGFIKRTPGHARTITLTNGSTPKKKNPCQTCYGTGEVEGGQAAGFGMVECPVCQGSGEGDAP